MLAICLLSGNLHADVLVDNANKAAKFLRENVIYSNVDEFAEEETVDAIRALSLALNHLNLTKESIISIKRIRVRAAHSLNIQRLYYDRPVDVSLAIRALKDIEYVLVKDKESVNSSLLYIAGHIALHEVKDTHLAYQFWEQCAELGHAGCMNTIAEESFTGMNGLPIDTNKSIFWHKKVFETGIKYQCAGLFSANALSNIAYYFPKFETDGDWAFWRKKRDLLLEELDPENEKSCRKGGLYLEDYIFSVETGTPDAALLEKAVFFTEEPLSLEVVKSIQRAATYFETLDLIKLLTNPYEQCGLTSAALFLSRYQNNSEAAIVFEDHFYTLDRVACSNGLATIQRLRDEGRW